MRPAPRSGGGPRPVEADGSAAAAVQWQGRGKRSLPRRLGCPGRGGGLAAWRPRTVSRLGRESPRRRPGARRRPLPGVPRSGTAPLGHGNGRPRPRRRADAGECPAGGVGTLTRAASPRSRSDEAGTLSAARSLSPSRPGRSTSSLHPSSSALRTRVPGGPGSASAPRGSPTGGSRTRRLRPSRGPVGRRGWRPGPPPPRSGAGLPGAAKGVLLEAGPGESRRAPMARCARCAQSPVSGGGGPRRRRSGWPTLTASLPNRNFCRSIRGAGSKKYCVLGYSPEDLHRSALNSLCGVGYADRARGSSVKEGLWLRFFRRWGPAPA